MHVKVWTIYFTIQMKRDTRVSDNDEIVLDGSTLLLRIVLASELHAVFWQYDTVIIYRGGGVADVYTVVVVPASPL